MSPPLSAAELELLRSVFQKHEGVRAVKLFGSRAKGTHTTRSDVDLALWGAIDPLEAEQIAAELDELPLPYRYDVHRFEGIQLEPLRSHIERVGIAIYPEVMAGQNSLESAPGGAPGEGKVLGSGSRVICGNKSSLISQQRR